MYLNPALHGVSIKRLEKRQDELRKLTRLTLHPASHEIYLEKKEFNEARQSRRNN